MASMAMGTPPRPHTASMTRRALWAWVMRSSSSNGCNRPVEVSAIAVANIFAPGWSVKACSSTAGSRGFPSSVSRLTTLAPARREISTIRPLKKPRLPEMIVSPSSRRLLNTASAPEKPEPEMQRVISFCVWKTRRRNSAVSSRILNISGSRCPSWGADAIRRMRGSTLHGPGPSNNRYEGLSSGKLFCCVSTLPVMSCVIVIAYLSFFQGGGKLTPLRSFLFLEEMVQFLCLIDCDQVINKFVKLTIEHAGEIMACQADAVVGDTILWEVIGANLLATITHLYLGSS